ncbi:MAG: Fic family protein [Candidatus Micrarchaeia archaeon]
MRLPEKPPKHEKAFHTMLAGADLTKMAALASTANAEYLYWEEIKHDNRFDGIDRTAIWEYLRAQRRFNARLIPFGPLLLLYSQTPQIEKLLHDLDFRAGGKIGLEEQAQEPALQKKYLTNSLMEEAIASSQLEGAATSRVVAKQMLRENRKPKNPSEKMIVNNYLTMKHIRESTSANETLTPEIIKQIHKDITKGTLEKPEYEGAFRTDNEVKVYAIDDPTLPIYEPPDYREIESLIKQVCNFANTEPTEYYLHPIIKAIILHYMIGYIHPFNDGNGRTARALFYWYLISRGYQYFEYIAVSRTIKEAPAQYARAYLYTEYDSNDVTYFVRFNLHSLDKAVGMFEKYLEKTAQENKKMLETVRKNPKLNMRQADILIITNKGAKSITIQEMQERYRTTYQTARTDLLKLAKMGYLHKLRRGKEFVFIPDKEKCLKE